MIWQPLLALGLLVAVQDPTSLSDAEAMVLRGNYTEAIELFDKLKGADPVRVGLGKSQCLASEGKYAEGMLVLQTAIITQPQSADLHAAMADLLITTGQYDDATAAAQRGSTCGTKPGPQMPRIVRESTSVESRARWRDTARTRPLPRTIGTVCSG